MTAGSAEEVFEFWFSLMRNEKAEPRDRLKASENLARYVCAEAPEPDRSVQITVDYAGVP